MMGGPTTKFQGTRLKTEEQRGKGKCKDFIL